MAAGGFGGAPLTTEDYFAECLEVALDHGGDDPRVRSRAAKDSAAWKQLVSEPEWKGLVLSVLNVATESASATMVTPGRPLTRGGRRGGMRSRRERKQTDELESPESLVTSTKSDAYRLTGLLLHRHRQGENWNTEWNRSITELRNMCSNNGVHPIWPRLGREFEEVLGELALLKAVESKTAALDLDWLRLARINPLNPSALAEFISPPIPTNLSARIASPLQELHDLLMRRADRTNPRWLAGKLNVVAGKEVLPERTGATGLIAAMLVAASGQNDEAIERFGELKEDAELCELAHDHVRLLRIHSGDVDVWDSCRKMTGDDGLASACRIAAWSTEPPADIDLSVEDIENGLAELMSADCRQMEMVGLRWRLVRAHCDTGNFSLAMVEMDELDIVEMTHVNICLGLLEFDESGTLLGRLNDSMDSLSTDSLLTIIQHQDSPDNLTLTASERLRTVDESLWLNESDELLRLFVSCAAIEPLATLLSMIDCSEQNHSLLVLLIHQLLPANAPADVLKWLENARTDAQHANDIEAQHPLLSELSRSLILQLDGSHVESTAVFERLDKKGLKAYKQCRYALSKGGRGHIGLKEFSDLSDSIHEANLDSLEKDLFEVVLAELRLGWAIHERESHDSERERQAELEIDDMIRNDGRHKLLGQVQRMVLEHGLASHALVEWNELHSSNSFWSELAIANVYEQGGERELAARSFGKAAVAASAVTLPENFDSDHLQLRSSLQKGALTNYAHASCWAEAVRILESIDKHVVNIKRVFDLYLRVSEAADKKKLERATEMVMDYAHNEVRDDAGDIDEKLLLEELHQLLSYPSELKLPEDPFRGRILVAINTIRSGHQRSQAGSETKFRRALQERDVPSVGELARQAADERGVENGLLVYERAMNSGRFSDTHTRQLTDMMKGLFSRHDSDIPIRRRMHLSRLKLKALVLMDTNLLIDALRDRLLQQAHTVGNPPSVESRLAFHRTLIYRMQQGRIDLTVPAAARNELRSFIGNETRTRALLGRKVSESRWEKMVEAGDIKHMAEQIITEYSNWHAPDEKQFNEKLQDRRGELLKFMSTSLSNVYLGIDEDKRIRGFDSKRTEIDGIEIYPECGDLDIMLLAAELVERADPVHGSVLVASRDSDFCIPGRALQERFGFGIVNNAQTLSRWVN